jgi:hypothetical protein
MNNITLYAFSFNLPLRHVSPHRVHPLAFEGQGTGIDFAGLLQYVLVVGCISQG